MIPLSIVYAYLVKAFRFVLAYKWIVAVVVLSLVVILLWMSKEKPINVEIDDKTETIENIQKKKDERIDSEFNSIDERRRKDDELIRNAQTKPVRNGNVTADELERLLNGKR